LTIPSFFFQISGISMLSRLLSSFSEQPHSGAPIKPHSWSMYDRDRKIAFTLESRTKCRETEPWKVTTSIDGECYFSQALLIALLPIIFTQTQIPFVHGCHYLLCRTLFLAPRETGLSTIIEDIVGDVCLIQLYVFETDADPNLWIPQCSIWAIKKPYLKLEPHGSVFI
jgi:hypothetical protein